MVRSCRMVLVLAMGVLAIASPSSALERVSVAGIPTPARMPVLAAIAAGYFADEGLEIEWVATRAGSDGTKMLAGGAVQFAAGQLIDAVNLHRQKVDVRVIAMLTDRMANSILVRKDLAGEVRSLTQMKGLRIGVTGVGSGTWQLAVFAAKSVGLRPDDLNIISVGTGAAVVGAVKSKRIDLLSYADPENVLLVRDGDAAFLLDMADHATQVKILGDSYLNNQIMVHSDFAKQNPKKVQSFLNAVQRGVNWIRSHSVEDLAAALRTLPYFQNMDAETLLLTVRRQIGQDFMRTAVVTPSAFDNALKLPLSVGVLKDAVPMDALVDNSFAEAAAQAFPPGGAK